MGHKPIELWEQRFNKVFPNVLKIMENEQLTLKGDFKIQGLQNMVMLDGEPADRRELSASDVCSFIDRVAHSWQNRSESAGARIFYAWYDEMAGQLRMSMVVAGSRSDLPFFGPTLLFVEDAEQIALAYLSGSDLIIWNDLIEITEEDFVDDTNAETEMDYPDLEVFVKEFGE